MLLDMGKQEMHRATATKATACILHHCLSDVSPAQLRPLVQREIKQLRAGGIKEAEWLHPILMERVQAVLAMKS